MRSVMPTLCSRHGMYLTIVERSWRREGCRPRAEGGGVPRPPPDGSDQRANSGVSEDPEAAVAVAAEDVGEAVFADERLNAPEVVAFGVEVAAHLDELTRRVVLRVGALDLDRAQPARVVRQVGERRVLRIDRHLVDAEVTEPEREVRIVRLWDGEGVELLQRRGVEEVNVTPSVKDGPDLDLGADGADREVLGVGPRRIQGLQAEQPMERRVGGADGHDLVHEGTRAAERLAAGGPAAVGVDGHHRIPAGQGDFVGLLTREAG